MSLAKKSLGTLLSKGVIFFLRFPFGIIVARFLGPEGKGLLHLLLMAVAISAALGQFGQGSAAVYFIGKDKQRFPAVFTNLLVLAGTVSVVLYSAGWLFLRYIRPDLYVQLPLQIWIMAALMVPALILQSFFSQILSAFLRIKEINLVQVLGIFLDLILLVLLVVILGMGVGGALLAHVLSDVLVVVTLLLLILRYAGRPAKPDWVLMKELLRFGLKSYLYNLERRVNLRLDAFLIAGLAAGGVAATGLYSVAVNLAELILFLPVSIRMSLLPMVAAGSITEANRLTSMACRHTMFLSVLVALSFIVAGPIAIPFVYGENFTGAVVPLMILLPGIILLAQARIIYSDLVGRGRPEVSTISAAVGMVATVILDLLLIPSYGIGGAAIASTCAYTIEFLVAVFCFVRISQLPWNEVLLLQNGDLLRYQGLLYSFVRGRRARA